MQHYIRLGTVVALDLKAQRIWLACNVRYVHRGSLFVGNHCSFDGKLISRGPTTLPQLTACFREELNITPRGVLSFLGSFRCPSLLIRQHQAPHDAAKCIPAHNLTEVVLSPIMLTFAPIVIMVGEAVHSHTHTESEKLGKHTLVNVEPLRRLYFLGNLIAFQLHS